MVGDKINYRTPGKVVGMTKQPTKGRSNEGGLRIGEMETNCLIAHGISTFMKESFVERSDKNEIYVDPESGDVAGKNKFMPRVLTPYAFKLLLQEVQTMGIIPRVQVGGNDDDEDSDDGEVYGIEDMMIATGDDENVAGEDEEA